MIAVDGLVLVFQYALFMFAICSLVILRIDVYGEFSYTDIPREFEGLG